MHVQHWYCCQTAYLRLKLSGSLPGRPQQYPVSWLNQSPWFILCSVTNLLFLTCSWSCPAFDFEIDACYLVTDWLADFVSCCLSFPRHCTCLNDLAPHCTPIASLSPFLDTAFAKWHDTSLSVCCWLWHFLWHCTLFSIWTRSTSLCLGAFHLKHLCNFPALAPPVIPSKAFLTRCASEAVLAYNQVYASSARLPCGGGDIEQI